MHFGEKSISKNKPKNDRMMRLTGLLKQLL